MSFPVPSARLRFRIWDTSDSALAEDLWGNPAVTELITKSGTLTHDQIRARLASEIKLQDTYGVQYWPVFHTESGRHVGCCGLHPYRPVDRIYEIGVHLKPESWGQGYAQEAARAVFRFAFAKLGASGLFAGHNPANQASRTLLRRLGFRYTHDEFYEPTGRLHPSYLLTREEWEPSRLPGTASDLQEL